MIYFISGHGDLTQFEFDKYYVPVLDDILVSDRDAEFVVGDFQGADTMAQDYLKEKLSDPSKLTVYHMGRFPRYCSTTEFKLVGGFSSDEERDSAMTQASNVDICFVRPGRRGSGSAQNIVRRYEIIE